MMGKLFKLLKQKDSMDCGPTCLNMVASHYGKRYNIKFLRKNTQIGKDGVNLLGIAQASEKIGQVKTLQ